jgi:hypothetical protein
MINHGLISLLPDTPVISSRDAGYADGNADNTCSALNDPDRYDGFSQSYNSVPYILCMPA